MFKCDCCGECCRKLNYSELYKDLDRGDGICKYLVENKCSIYESRPLICRIDESYDMFFSDLMSKEDFYKLNQNVCTYFKK